MRKLDKGRLRFIKDLRLVNMSAAFGNIRGYPNNKENCCCCPLRACGTTSSLNVSEFWKDWNYPDFACYMEKQGEMDSLTASCFHAHFY